MTLVATTRKHRMERPPQSSTPDRNFEQQFRLLDHVLARSYVREILRRRASAANRQNTPQIFKPRMDLCDDPNCPRIIAMLELPGLKQEDISVRIEGETLVVQGERRSPLTPWRTITPSSPGGAALVPASPTSVMPSNYKVQELKYGGFSREIVLPTGMQVAHVQASLSEGMLTLSWPRNPLAEPVVSDSDRAQSEDFRGSESGGSE